MQNRRNIVIEFINCDTMDNHMNVQSAYVSEQYSDLLDYDNKIDYTQDINHQILHESYSLNHQALQDKFNKTGRRFLVWKNRKRRIPVEILNIALNYCFQKTSTFLYETGCDRSKCLQILITNGANADHKNQIGDSVLFSSIKQKDLASVHVLLKAGCSTRVVDNLGRTVLNVCIRRFPLAMSVILEHSSTDYVHQDFGESIFDVAIEHRDLVSLNVLLSKIPYTDCIDESGQTALHHAVMKLPTAVDRLLKYDANVNTQDNTLTSPLMLAVQKAFNYYERELYVLRPVERLLQAGANVNMVDYEGKAAIHHLLLTRPHEVLDLDLLMKYGADVNSQDTRKTTPLSLVIRNIIRPELLISLVERLVHAGAAVNLTDTDGRAPIHHFFCRRPDNTFYDNDSHLVNVLGLLIQCEADINMQDNNGIRPIHLALSTSNYSGVLTLIAHCCVCDFGASIQEQVCYICYYDPCIVCNSRQSQSKYRTARLLLKLGIVSLKCNELNKYVKLLTLKQLCRKVIRENLGMDINKTIHKVPTSVIDFIRWKDIYEEYYSSIHPVPDEFPPGHHSI